MKVAIGAIVLSVVVLGGAYALVTFISGMTPIHVTETLDYGENPPSPDELVRAGAMIAVVGRVETVHDAEWMTVDFSRPHGPGDVSDVPDRFWIHTPVEIAPDDPVIVLREMEVAETGFQDASTSILFAVRGGEIDNDVHTVEGPMDRDLVEGDQILVVLGAIAGEPPELHQTSHGPAWEFLQYYRLRDDGTAVLHWDDDEHTYQLDSLIAEFRQAAR